jgi:ribosome-binding protein aMBF1 (putative translation factor)
MEEFEESRCAMCNAYGDLVDAVGQEELIKVCSECARKNNLPVIHRATDEEMSKVHNYYRRNFNKNADLAATQALTAKKSPEDRELENVLKKNIQKGDYPELIDNFHWHIQHARRLKKLSQKQLAEAIAEKEIMIDLAEQGKLADNREAFVTKLEQYLRVQLRKEPLKKPEVPQPLSEDETSEEENQKDGWFSTKFKRFKEKWFSDEENADAENEESIQEESEADKEDRLVK